MENELPKKLDIQNIFRKSWEDYKRNWKILTISLIVLGLVSWLANSRVEESVFFMVLSMVAGVITQVVVINASLGAVRGTLVPSQLWSRMNRAVPLFVTSILVGVLVFLGLLLLVVPGLMLMVALQLAQYFVVDQNRGIIDSLYASADATRGVRWPLFGLMVVVILVNIAGGLLFGVGLIITVPLTYIALARAYEELTKTGLGHRVPAV